MVRVTFVSPKGEKIEAEGAAGSTLLEIGQAAGMPLEGTCEGQMACSTCHVIVASEWFGKLPVASDDEEDMLDLAANAGPTSRLSCQIIVNQDLDGVVVRVPDTAHDMMRR
ncbi:MULTISPECIES: 2Fe-2S iron-sulfur cluster-binding protein [unclassified Croceicoccus]|jgi:ferredoxin|uniref:2Fe-2S iron-sulfur cluster-binding protein n=1 Tax=unclassified Croceicoccus TaxID=2629967 RepID=UPI001E5EE23A|nr:MULTISPECIES: 2Fe-2S iron-sulfur cluster-binding protein [unclassified Croceicoccus]